MGERETFLLKRAADEPLAAKVREAVGVGPNEPVQVLTAGPDRLPGMAPVAPPPGLPTDWHRLRAMTQAELKALGCGAWDGAIMLFPAEWHRWVPAGFEVVTISGERRPFVPGKHGDRVAGCLAYGVEAIDPTPDEEGDHG